MSSIQQQYFRGYYLSDNLIKGTIRYFIYSSDITLTSLPRGIFSSSPAYFFFIFDFLPGHRSFSERVHLFHIKGAYLCYRGTHRLINSLLKGWAVLTRKPSFFSFPESKGTRTKTQESISFSPLTVFRIFTSYQDLCQAVMVRATWFSIFKLWFPRCLLWALNRVSYSQWLYHCIL